MPKGSTVEFNGNEAIVCDEEGKNYFEYKNNKWIWVASKEW